MRQVILHFVLALIAAAVAAAAVTPAALFTDHAVLQRDKPVPIWGAADAGEKITVTFGEQKRTATTAKDGRWLVLLDALPASTQGTDLTIAGKNTVVLRDVVVGEVWLCSGQSNMEWTVARAANAEREIAAANFPLLRHLKIEKTIGDAPRDTVKTSGGWQAATPQTVGAFTAVGYYFARDLHQKLGVPIGLVNATWGGTPVEAWLSPAALASRPEFAVAGERWRQWAADYPAQGPGYERARDAWAKADAEVLAKGGRPAQLEWRKQNPAPRIVHGGADDPWRPAGLFNGMINPLLPGALRGAIWYQGESNADRAAEYHALFSAMITAWRAHFGQGDFPFFWVSLANFKNPNDPSGRSYAFLREAQAKTLALPNTGQALAIDLGNPDDIHPLNKQDVGRRLALLARHRVYGFTGDDTGPTFASATREAMTLPTNLPPPPAPAKAATRATTKAPAPKKSPLPAPRPIGPVAAMRVRFTHAQSGLIARDKPVQSLELAGADRVFHPAEGWIERDTLVVFSPAVKEPVAVRYAWTNSPEANLYNGAGLPAVPFRSDEW